MLIFGQKLCISLKFIRNKLDLMVVSCQIFFIIGVHTEAPASHIIQNISDSDRHLVIGLIKGFLRHGIITLRFVVGPYL